VRLGYVLERNGAATTATVGIGGSRAGMVGGSGRREVGCVRSRRPRAVLPRLSRVPGRIYYYSVLNCSNGWRQALQ
jgi:hypothetical protein